MTNDAPAQASVEAAIRTALMNEATEDGAWVDIGFAAPYDMKIDGNVAPSLIAKAVIASLSPPPTVGAIPVERVEMEGWSTGYAEEAEPIWRIVLNGYCADFPSEGAARNFAAQIEARQQPPTVGAEDEVPVAWRWRYEGERSWSLRKNKPDDWPDVEMQPLYLRSCIASEKGASHG